MNTEQEQLKTIYMGYHPRAHDGSPPQSRTFQEALAVQEAFNNRQEDGRLRAELVQIAYTDYCAVAIMETTIDKVWQYI